MMNSDNTEGNSRLPKILLNGNNICMVNDTLQRCFWVTNLHLDGTRRRRSDCARRVDYVAMSKSCMLP